jgi:hypothetical protein
MSQPPQLNIEHRAVSAAFLRSFTKSKVTPSLSKQCTKEGIAWNKNQITFLKEKLELTQTTYSLNEIEPNNNYKEQIEEIKRRLSRLEYDLKERESRPAYMSTRDVHSKIIKAETDSKHVRYVELSEWSSSTFVGKADYFISHSWNSPWQSVVDAVCEHSDSQLPSITFYWIDIFAINQHWKDSQYCTGSGCIGCSAVQEDMPRWEIMQSSHNVGFERVIRNTSKTLLVMEPWDRPRPPTRVWCLYESYVSLMNGELSVILGEDQRRKMQLSLKKEFSQILSSVRNIDAKKADVTVEQDRINIFGAIEDLQGGFDGLNNALRQSLYRWLADASLKFLSDINPDGPPRSLKQLQIDTKILGKPNCFAYLLKFLSHFPGFFELLTLIAVLSLCALLLGPWYSLYSSWWLFDSCKPNNLTISKKDNAEHGFLIVFIIMFVLSVIATVANTTVNDYSLRRTQLFSCGRCCQCFDHYFETAVEWFHSFEGFVLNYLFPFGLAVVAFYGGGSGLFPFIIVFLVTCIIYFDCVKRSLDYDEFTRFSEQTAWLLLESKRNEEAADLFEKVANYWQRYSTNHVRACVNMLYARVGQILAMHKCNRHLEANEITMKSIHTIEHYLKCHVYWFYQFCHKSGSCAWASRACHGGDRNSYKLQRRDWLYLKACILAANGEVSDDRVLDVLEQTVDLGFYSHRIVDSENFGNDDWRLTDRSPAFADLTKRVDAEESNISDRQARLIKIEKRMSKNEKQVKWRGYLDIVILLGMVILYVSGVTELRSTVGNPCDSVDGSTVLAGFRGCGGELAGTYCNLTKKQCFCRKISNGTNGTNETLEYKI